MPDQCQRCGEQRSADPGLPHRGCWDSRVDERGATLLFDAAGRGSRAALSMLGDLGDERAAPLLRTMLSERDARLRTAAIRGLGWSGVADDVVLVAPALEDPDQDVRRSARATVAELGGPAAADILWESLRSARAGGDGDNVLDALAWLKDPRVRDDLRLSVPRRMGATRSRGDRGVAWALVRVGDRDDRELLRDQLLIMVRAARFLEPGMREFTTRDAFAEYFLAVNPMAPDEFQETVAMMAAIDPDRARRYTVSEPGDLLELQPILERTVAKQTLVRSEARPPGACAKFGGLPEWREPPTWPVDDAGDLLRFYGQVPLPSADATAYVFVGEGPDWEPLSPANCVVVQPGPPPHRPTRTVPVGPQLFLPIEEQPQRYRRRTRMQSIEHFFTLEPAHDPPAWTWPSPADGVHRRDINGDWNKVGGTPLFLQGEFGPAGDGWSFAGQFNASSVGYELADGAECYLFVHQDGSAAFGWQCH